MSVLDKSYFYDEAAAFAYLEGVLWPNGPVCPHCGSLGAYEIKGKTARVGLKKCTECRKQFTVRVGKVFESSHVPLHKWLQVTFLLCNSKKGISAHQLHRTLEVTYKTAWFMAHRLRAAMARFDTGPMGGEDKVVEADETYVGGKKKNKHRNKRIKAGRGAVGKAPVVSLIKRGGGVRSFHVPKVTAKKS